MKAKQIALLSQLSGQLATGLSLRMSTSALEKLSSFGMILGYPRIAKTYQYPPTPTTPRISGWNWQWYGNAPA